jgi:hypothetical protein
MAKGKSQADINRELREAVELLKQQAEEQAKVSNSMEGYLDGIKRLKTLRTEENRILKIINKLKADDASLTKDEKDAQAKKVALLEKELGLLKEKGDALADNLQQVNKGNLLAAKATGGLVKTFAKLPDLAETLRKRIKNLGIVDMDKAMKKSALSMGVLSKQSDGFRTSFKEASKYTNQLGIGIEELAKMQAD